MRGATLALCALCAGVAMADEDQGLPGGPPLDAAAFDALTLGKRMDTFDPQRLYGIEDFLPGRRSIWKSEKGCKTATWAQVGDQICFWYEDRPEDPDCWVYTLQDGVIWGWYQGRREGPVVRLVPGTRAMACGYLGA